MVRWNEMPVLQGWWDGLRWWASSPWVCSSCYPPPSTMMMMGNAVVWFAWMVSRSLYCCCPDSFMLCCHCSHCFLAWLQLRICAFPHHCFLPSVVPFFSLWAFYLCHPNICGQIVALLSAFGFTSEFFHVVSACVPLLVALSGSTILMLLATHSLFLASFLNNEFAFLGSSSICLSLFLYSPPLKSPWFLLCIDLEFWGNVKLHHWSVALPC